MSIHVYIHRIFRRLLEKNRKEKRINPEAKRGLKMVNKPMLMTVVLSGVLGVGVAVLSVIVNMVIAVILAILLCLTLLSLRKKARKIREKKL